MPPPNFFSGCVFICVATKEAKRRHQPEGRYVPWVAARARPRRHSLGAAPVRTAAGRPPPRSFAAARLLAARAAPVRNAAARAPPRSFAAARLLAARAAKVF